VVGVDARSTRFPEDPRVTWVEQDIRQHDLSGYEVILCLGLFYHLGLLDQLELLKRCAGTPLIIDTHVANAEASTGSVARSMCRATSAGGTQSQGW
jgi:hypothetical protein